MLTVTAAANVLFVVLVIAGFLMPPVSFLVQKVRIAARPQEPLASPTRAFVLGLYGALAFAAAAIIVLLLGYAGPAMSQIH